MNYASLDAVHIESVLIHKSHATQQENPPSDGTKRLVTWRNKHLQDSLHQREDSNFSSHQQHVHRDSRRDKQCCKQRKLALGVHVLSCFEDAPEELVEVNEVVNRNHFTAF